MEIETKYKISCPNCKKKTTHTVYTLSKKRGVKLKCENCGFIKNHWCNFQRLKTKEIKSIAEKVRMQSVESRLKISKAKMGAKRKPFSELHKKRISESNMGRKASPKTRKLISIAKTGGKLSKETKEKISNSMMGNQNNLGIGR